MPLQAGVYRTVVGVPRQGPVPWDDGGRRSPGLEFPSHWIFHDLDDWFFYRAKGHFAFQIAGWVPKLRHEVEWTKSALPGSL